MEGWIDGQMDGWMDVAFVISCFFRRPFALITIYLYALNMNLPRVAIASRSKIFRLLPRPFGSINLLFARFISLFFPPLIACRALGVLVIKMIKRVGVN